MYSIRPENFFGIEKLILCNQISGEYLSVIPAFGGNLNELVLLKNAQLHKIISGDETLETLSGMGSNFYRGAKLSPFPNRINEGKYTFRGKEYQLNKNAPPHALHGLCWNIPFAVREQSITGNFARLVLEADYKALQKGFPFTYHIEIEYTLEENNFKCSTKILNTYEHPIPVGDGWHPYFTLGSTISNLKLQLPPNKQLEMSNSLIPTGNYLPGRFFSPTLLNETLLDDCFELEVSAGIAETRLIDEQKNICLVIWQEAGSKGYGFIQAYTPQDRNSIAIEPMSCAPDAFNNKRGLIILSPEESIEFCFGARLD
ncbi:MAG: aldose 1-epimerase [Bacteroidia bacterium]